MKKIILTLGLAITLWLVAQALQIALGTSGARIVVLVISVAVILTLLTKVLKPEE